MKPVVAYDGHCKFCRKSVNTLDKIGGHGRFRYVTLDRLFYERPEERLYAGDGLGFLKSGEEALWGADAVYGALNELPFWRMPARLYLVPGLKQFAQATYNFVAKNRYIFGKCGGICEK